MSIATRTAPKHAPRIISLAAVSILAIVAGGIAPTAIAQTSRVSPEAASASSPDALKRLTLSQMMKPVTVTFEDNRLEDVIGFLAELTGADLSPLWINDRQAVGLDRDTEITLSVKNLTALDVLERVMDEAADSIDEPNSNSWQFTKYGSLEFGPKERLNRRQRVQIYDIKDLLLEIPDYNNAPEFDLQSALQGNQGGGGGGGGGGLFQQQGQQQQPQPSREDRLEEITDLIVTLVEPEQWTDFGGNGGTISLFQDNLVIRAADYMHRQIDGYAWWPQGGRAVVRDGRRTVSFTGSTSRSQVQDLGTTPKVGP